MKTKTVPQFNLALIHVLKPFRHLFKKTEIGTRERTKLCYILLNKWCAKICGINCWADCSITDPSKNAYNKKYIEILDLVKCDANTSVLEIGPGTGELLKLASLRSKDVVGLDICHENVKTCAQKGLKVVLGDAINSLKTFPDNRFDIVIANSSMEHAVTEEDAVAGKADEIYKQLLNDISRILKPNGRLYISLIHFRNPEVIEDAVKDPFEFPVNSKKFHLSLLVYTFSGWYPYKGQLDVISQHTGLKKVYEYNGTQDYLASCKNWPVLKSIYNPLVAIRLFFDKEIRSIIWKYPYYCYTHIIKLLAYSWTWQFVASKDEEYATPTEYLCQVYEKK